MDIGLFLRGSKNMRF